MAKKSMQADFVKERSEEGIAGLSLCDMTKSLLSDEGEVSPSLHLSILRSTTALRSMFERDGGTGLRFLVWANILSRALESSESKIVDFGHFDDLPVDITPLVVLETRFLSALVALHDKKVVRLGPDITSFKMLTGRGLDQRIVALSALISPSAVSAYLHGPCGSWLWRAISGNKKEMQEVCERFYRLTGFSQNDLYCIGGTSPAFWQELFKYLPELFFSFYAALIAHYRLGERSGSKRDASDMLTFHEHQFGELAHHEHIKSAGLSAKRLHAISTSRELAVIHQAADVLLANSICERGYGFNLHALFGALKSEEKRIADDVVSRDFCSHGMISAALQFDFWCDFTNDPDYNHDLLYVDGSLLPKGCGGASLGLAAVAAWCRGEPFESIGLSRVYF